MNAQLISQKYMSKQYIICTLCFYFYYTNECTINIIKVYVKTIYNLYSMFRHDDKKMLKHVEVQIIHCCDINFYDINCAFLKQK